MPNNPPIPVGYQLMKQVAVTPAMSAWAVEILHDQLTFPMFSVSTRAFGALTVLARVEWHSPDFENNVEHRGVTLYTPVPDKAAATDLAEGVDVSGYQPDVAWSEVANSGAEFAFIKATESTTLLDHAFNDHWVQAKQAGVLRGAYHFFRPQQDAAAQANFFLAQLGDPGELPPVLDVETADGASGAQIAAGIETWLDLVTASVGRPLIYTSPGFWNSISSLASVAPKADLWVAHWGARTPAPVSGWSDWRFWQYTNKATISGIPGTADMDQDRFNDSVAALQAYSARFVAARGQPPPSVFNLRTTLGVQRALNFLRAVDPPLVEDGLIGPRTKAAIEAFQRDAGIAADGIVGPNTIAALQRALAA